LENLPRIGDKDRYLRGVPRLNPANIQRGPAHWPTRGISGGFHWSGEVPPGALVGPHGCGPCVGVILIPPTRTGVFYVFHFGAQDDPAGTFDAVLGTALTRARLQGYRAVLNGAQLGEGSDNEVLRTLSSVRYGLDTRGVRILGYVPGPNADVDRDGNIYWTTPATYTRRGY